MAFSMENLKDRGEQIQRTVGEKVKTAEEMRAEIDALKQGLEGMPTGLDDEITSAISEAREAGRREAISDIEGVEGEVEAANQEGASINAEIDNIREHLGDQKIGIHSLHEIWRRGGRGNRRRKREYLARRRGKKSPGRGDE